MYIHLQLQELGCSAFGIRLQLLQGGRRVRLQQIYFPRADDLLQPVPRQRLPQVHLLAHKLRVTQLKSESLEARV